MKETNTMIKFEVRVAATLDGETAYRFDVGIVDEFQAAVQFIPPDGVMTKEMLSRVCYQLADHLADGKYTNDTIAQLRVISDLLKVDNEIQHN